MTDSTSTVLSPANRAPAQRACTAVVCQIRVRSRRRTVTKRDTQSAVGMARSLEADHPPTAQTTVRPSLQAGGRLFEPGTLHSKNPGKRGFLNFFGGNALGAWPQQCRDGLCPLLPSGLRCLCHNHGRQRAEEALMLVGTPLLDHADGEGRELSGLFRVRSHAAAWQEPYHRYAR